MYTCSFYLCKTSILRIPPPPPFKVLVRLVGSESLPSQEVEVVHIHKSCVCVINIHMYT